MTTQHAARPAYVSKPLLKMPSCNCSATAPISDNRSNFLGDNIHPTAAAQPKLRDHVLKALKPLLAD